MDGLNYLFNYAWQGDANLFSQMVPPVNVLSDMTLFQLNRLCNQDDP